MSRLAGDAGKRYAEQNPTLLGDLGPWRERIYVVGGLAARYLVGALPAGAPRVGTTDADLALGIALGDTPETYRTQHAAPRRAASRRTSPPSRRPEGVRITQGQPSFPWTHNVDRTTVVGECLCEADQVDPAASSDPAKCGAAVNVTGAMLSRDDYSEGDVDGRAVRRPRPVAGGASRC